MIVSSERLKSDIKRIELIMSYTEKFLKRTYSAVMESQLARLSAELGALKHELSLAPLREFFEKTPKQKKKKNAKKRR